MMKYLGILLMLCAMFGVSGCKEGGETTTDPVAAEANQADMKAKQMEGAKAQKAAGGGADAAQGGMKMKQMQKKGGTPGD